MGTRACLLEVVSCSVWSEVLEIRDGYPAEPWSKVLDLHFEIIIAE